MQSAIVSVHLFSIFVIIAGWVKAKGQRSLHFFNFCCPQFGYAGLVSLLFFSVSQQSIAANRLGPNLGAFETNGWAKCPDAPGFFGAFPGPNLLKPKGWFLVFPLPVFLVQTPRIGVNPSGWSSGQSWAKSLISLTNFRAAVRQHLLFVALSPRGRLNWLLIAVKKTSSVISMSCSDLVGSGALSFSTLPGKNQAKLWKMPNSWPKDAFYVLYFSAFIRSGWQPVLKLLRIAIVSLPELRKKLCVWVTAILIYITPKGIV